jgi:transcriptional regulator with AAA-type ATPase domain
MAGADRSPDSPAPPPPANAPPPAPADAHDFRWQALFQRSTEPFFVLNRRRRILFVNQAWENLTSLPALEARGLVCVRRPPTTSDPWDVTIRSLCCPPPEASKGKPCRSRRLVPGMKGGARWWDFDFLPLHDANGLLCILGKITIVAGAEPAEAPPLPEKLIALREGVRERYSLDQLAGSAPALQRIVEQVRLASQSHSPVLIQGEPGTGKRWVARTIHYQGLLAEGPFVALDCASLPSAALAAVLFGAPRPAEQGTLYLREPSRLPREVQAQLCDLLGESGSGQRLMAGCSVDLQEEVRNGRLLEELHCALSPLVITLPSVRERQADLPMLVERLLERASAVRESPVKRLTEEAWEVVRAHSWPGNLRELYSVLQAACLRAQGDQIDAGHLPASLRLAVRLDGTPTAAAETALPLDQLLEQAERRLIVLALRKAGGNRSRAAELLAIWRPRLLRRMEALGIEEW